MGWLTGWSNAAKHTIKPATGAGAEYQCRVRVNRDKLLDSCTKIGRYEGTNPVIAEDPYLVLCIHANGPNTSQNFYDDACGKAITAHGNAQVSTSIKKFGTGSLKLDGDGDYLSTPDHDDWALGNTFTIDLWIYLNSLPSDETYCFMTQYENNNNRWMFYLNDASGTKTIGLYQKQGGGVTINWSVSPAETIGTGEWIHFELVVNSLDAYIFQNGSLCGSTTLSYGITNFAGALLRIGVDWYNSAGVAYFDGYMDEITIRKGEARHTSEFTPPAGPYGPRYIREPGNILYESFDTGKEYKLLITGFGVYGGNESFYYYYSSDGKSWICAENNPVVRGVASGNSYEDPYVLKNGSTYYCFFEGGDDRDIIKRLDSSDFVTWSNEATVLNKGAGGQWDDYLVGSPVVWIESEVWYMLYEGMSDATHGDVGLATSNDGSSWTRDTSRAGVNTGKVFDRGSAGMWDDQIVANDDLYKDGSNYYMIYHGYDGSTHAGIGIAVSTNLTSWTRLNSGNRIVFDGEPTTTSTANRVQTAMIFSNNPRNWIYCSDTNPPNIGYTQGIYFGYLEENEIVALNGICKTDFGDIRFTDNDMETLLKQWPEHKTDSVYCDFWFKPTDSLEESDIDVYLYYGNAEATMESDGPNTFIEFIPCSGTITDDFTLRDQGGTPDATKEYTSGELHIKTNAAWDWGRVTKNITTTNRAIDCRFKVHGSANQPMTVGVEDEANWEKWYWAVYCDQIGTNLKLGTRISSWNANRVASTETFSTATYYRISCQDEGTSVKIVWMNDDGNIISKLTETTRDAGNFDLAFGAGTTNDESYWDDIRVRKYVDPEPRHADWTFIGAQTFTLDTLLSYKNIPETVDLEMLIKKLNIPETADLTALIQKQDIPETIDLTALVKKKDIPKTLNLDMYAWRRNISKIILLEMILGEPGTQIFRLSALLKKLNIPIAFDLDVRLQEALKQQTFDLEMVLKAVKSLTVALSTILEKKNIQKLLDLEIFLKKSETESFELQTLIQKLNIIKQVTLDMILIPEPAAGVRPFDLEMILVTRHLATATLDMILKWRKTKSIYMSMHLWKKDIPETVELDAIIKMIETVAADLDIIIKKIGSESVELDTLIQLKNIIVTFTLDTYLKYVGTEILDLDMILKIVKTVTINLSMILLNKDNSTSATLEMILIPYVTLGGTLRISANKSKLLIRSNQSKLRISPNKSTLTITNKGD